MKNTYKFLLAIGGSLIVGGAVGYGAYYSYEWFSNSNKSNKIHTYDTKLFSVDISERINGTDLYLDEYGVTKLKNRITDTLGIGPEWNSLNKILLTNDEKYIDSDVNGYYVPSVATIVINIDAALSRMVNYDVRAKKYNETWRDNWQNELIELLYQTIYHEYGHHIASSYFTSVPSNHPWMTDEIYHNNSEVTNKIYHFDKNNVNDDANAERICEPWFEDFITEFKSILKYSEDTPKLPADLIVNEKDEGANYKSIGSVYNQKDLFERANGQSEPTYKELENNNYAFAGNFSSYLSKADPEQINYLYSMQELFTRKFMQVRYQWRNDGAKLEKTNWFRKGTTNEIIWGEVNGREIVDNKIINIEYPTTVAYDRLLYETTRYGDKYYRYLYDTPYYEDKDNNTDVADNAKTFFDLYARYMGFDKLNHLSYIWSENTGELQSKTSISPPDSKSMQELNLGGYVDINDLTFVEFDKKQNSEEQIYLIWKNADGTFDKMEISLYEFYSSYKENIDFTSWKDPINLYTKYWTTDESINKDDIIDKQLYFGKLINGDIDENELMPLESVKRDSTSGLTTNYRTFGGDISFKDIAVEGIEKTDNNVTLTSINVEKKI